MDWSNLILVAGKLATETTQKYGPAAWDIALWLVRIDVGQYIAIGFLCMLLAYISYRYAQKFYKLSKENDYDYINLCILVWCFGVFPFSLATVINLFNVWNWVGLFYPELYLAKMALDKVI